MRISPQSVGFFLKSVGFPFDIQGPGSSRNVLLHFLHNKAIEDGNQTCSPPFLLGGTTRFPMAGQSFYYGYSINYPLQQDKTLIALHIYSQSITNRPAINLKVTETVSAYWNHLCANVNITPPPLLKGQFLHQKTHFP